MNNTLASNTIRFFVLLLAQVTICSNINLLGYINPYIYIIFILLFPVKSNRPLFLLCAFNLGLLVDMFLDSGGVHAGASVALAFVRPIFLKYAFGTLYDHQILKFNKLQLNELVIYISFMTLFHHFIVFNLEIFNIFQILLILKKTLVFSLFTVVLSTLLILLFKARK
ncbi:hypothetical protein DFQ05_1064 [Winogradskyella wandonensis]|uniref:Rod shape-determining protein MreD n=1 Tax=Winogradskyella wandonensis TaxID=1442586 RepID=A0A4R1KRT7_9FLAO|nr:rod shape-determining protein MreD [Winogradskyella wandonensis]TCK67290.1 hypothetical protein DFQ05_1064 [Winogradskyella wandonensis]